MPEIAKMYLLVEENFDELSERTGHPRETFEEMLRWDESWGLKSKIYVMPEKAKDEPTLKCKFNSVWNKSLGKYEAVCIIHDEVADGDPAADNNVVCNHVMLERLQ